MARVLDHFCLPTTLSRHVMNRAETMMKPKLFISRVEKNMINTV
jgi:hypothetical protein